MARVAQLSIALGVLGAILMLMGLFPGMTGIEPTPGLGVVQLLMVVTGFSLLILGAIGYVKFTFYYGQPSTLVQQIGIRLALTGIVFASLAGVADILGFGSNLRTEVSDIYFGPIQAVGFIGSFALSSLGVMIYAIAGEPELVDRRQAEEA